MAEIDGVGTDMTFLCEERLTHNVANHQLVVLAEGDVELVNGRVGIEGDMRVVPLGLLKADTCVWEEVGQFES